MWQFRGLFVFVSHSLFIIHSQFYMDIILLKNNFVFLNICIFIVWLWMTETADVRPITWPNWRPTDAMCCRCLGVGSDRLAIQSRGQINVVLSTQHLLSCIGRHRGQNGCHPNGIDRAWWFIRRVGSDTGRSRRPICPVIWQMRNLISIK